MIQSLWDICYTLDNRNLF